MRDFANPTENMAIGTVEKELKQMKKNARRLRALHRAGMLTKEMEAEARKRFTGIYRRFLVEALQ